MAWIGMAVIAVIFISLLVWLFQALSEDVPSNTIVELNLDQSVMETVPGDPVGRALTGEGIDIKTIVDGLEQAKHDDRVSGLLVRVSGNTMNIGQAEEIREAVTSFRESGKPAYLYSETFGQVENATYSYYLATAFDRIFMQPGGDVNLVGLRSEQFFLGDFFRKHGIEVDYDHRYEYKSAKDMLTESEFTEPFREANEAIINSQYAHLTEAIAEGRKIDTDQARKVVDEGPWYGHLTLDHGLVDSLIYRDEIFALMRDELGDDAEFLYLENYYGEAGSYWDNGAKVALIQGEGAIVGGESRYDPIMMQPVMGSETLARAFRSAVEDEVDAIIFRIESPGGAPWASEAVRREIHQAREQGIPVIATMGNVAGSGGYYLAMGANKIVAQPSTITASIGVVHGKFVTSELLKDFGINPDHVSTSPSSDYFAASEPYNEHQRERQSDWLDYNYEQFVERVADDRGMSFDEVHEVGKGRIWTGSDARDLGLIDALGGYHTALNLVREEAGIDPDTDIELKNYPPPPGFWDFITGEGPDRSEKLLIAETWRGVHQQLVPVIQVARVAGILEPYHLYEMPR